VCFRFHAFSPETAKTKKKTEGTRTAAVGTCVSPEPRAARRLGEPSPRGHPANGATRTRTAASDRQQHNLTPFVWFISHQATVLFSQNKPTITNQSAVLSLITNRHQPSGMRRDGGGGQFVFAWAEHASTPHGAHRDREGENQRNQLVGEIKSSACRRHSERGGVAATAK
jgi:hypothetical protein